MVPTIHSFTTLWITSSLIYFSGFVRTQSAPQCISDLDGLFANQTQPCELLASAMKACAGTEYPVETVSSFPLAQYPVPVPDSTSPFAQCECTDISYNLHQACGACQNKNGTDSNATMRRVWFRSCKEIESPSLFDNLPLPLWAKQIYEPAFSVAQAVQVEESGNPLSASISTITLGAPTGTTASLSAGSKSGTNTGVIVGAVVGGVAFLALLAGLCFFFVRRRNARKRVPPSAEFMKYAQERNMNQTTIPLTQAAYHPRSEEESRNNNPRGSVIRLGSGASEMDRLDPEGGGYAGASSSALALSRSGVGSGSGEDEAPPAFTPGLFKDPVFEKGVALNLAAVASASSPSIAQHQQYQQQSPIPLSGGGMGVGVGLGGGPSAYGYGGSASPSTYSPATPSVHHGSNDTSRLIHGKRGSTT